VAEVVIMKDRYTYSIRILPHERSLRDHGRLVVPIPPLLPDLPSHPVSQPFLIISGLSRVPQGSNDLGRFFLDGGFARA
jgi:hypothetical protein